MVAEQLLNSLNIPSPLERFHLKHSLLPNLTLDIKRDDLIHPLLSGNKVRKLLGHLESVSHGLFTGLISMGGPWSNHLHACSWLSREIGIPFVAIIRGQEPKEYSDTLKDMAAWGTRLVFVSRADYREIRTYYENPEHLKPAILKTFEDYYFIPEGGRDTRAIEGLNQLTEELDHDYDAIYLGVGTGTTLAGLLNSWSNSTTHIYGILAVDAQDSQQLTISELTRESKPKYSLLDEYTFGGFAKTNEHLLKFMLDFHRDTGVPLEPVYTGKAMYALQEHINEGRYDEGANILFIHTGGLQGLRGYSELTPLLGTPSHLKLEI